LLSPSQISLANQVAQSLLNNGAPADKLGWMIGQLSIESSNFTDPKATDYNNFGGIKFYNQDEILPGVYDTGMISPEKDNYAGYDSIDDFSNDYLRILNTVGTARPLQQTTPENFVQALATNGYFTGDLSNYINIVKTNSAYYLNNVLTNLKQDVKAVATAATTAIKKNPATTIFFVGSAFLLLLLLTNKQKQNG
jgi:hypothetical protein